MMRRAARLNPLSDWPNAYAAWVPQLWAELEAAELERRLAELPEVHHG